MASVGPFKKTDPSVKLRILSEHKLRLGAKVIRRLMLIGLKK